MAATIRALGDVLDARTFRVFGELFGGAYPHPDVAAVPGLVPVQTGIWYAPDLRFAAFDVAVDDETGGEHFIAFTELEQAAQQVGLAVVPVLARGSRVELERISERFPTHVPRALELPPIASNWAEGWVLKPDVRAPVGRRPCMKRKIAELDETAFDEAQPLRGPSSLTELRQLALHLVGPARIASARSKIGADTNAIVDEVVLDVLVDLHDVFPVFVSRLSAADEQALARAIETAARSAIEA